MSADRPQSHVSSEPSRRRRAARVAPLLILALATPVQAEPIFRAPYLLYDVGLYPTALAAADFNGDGRPDIATTISYSHSVSVLLGQGDGTFGPRASYSTGGGPSSVAVGDVNGDGRPDLVVTHRLWNTVGVLPGNGDGTFQGWGGAIFTGSAPTSVAIGEVTGDGRADLVVANSGSNTVSVIPGNGDGTFRAKIDFGTGSQPLAVAIADLDANGWSDLVVANQASNSVSVLLGTGGGAFGSKVDFATGSSPWSVAVADLDEDGRPDLAVANAGSNTVSVLLGIGDGTFAGRTDFGTGAGPASVGIADLDVDGHLDLIAANSSQYPGARSVSVLIGDGAGAFEPAVEFATFGNPIALAIEDFDGDDRLDLAAVGTNHMLAVMFGNGDGTFLTLPRYPTGAAHDWIAAADLDGDGRTDLATANTGPSPDYSGSVSILPGGGDGSLGAGTDYATGSHPRALGVADLNRDGRPDLVTTNHNSNTVSVLLGRSDGTFGGRTDYGTRGSPQWVAIADLNADGIADLTTANGGGGTLSVLLGNGDGTFRPVEAALECYSYAVAVGDLDTDGRPDLVAAMDCGKIQMLPGLGDGTFGLGRDIGGRLSARSLAIADLNADGRLDLATSGDMTSVLLGNGDGTFGPRIDVDALGGHRVAVADMDGDGRLDLVTAGVGIAVLRGNGDGTFGPATRFGGVGHAMAIADFNGDGRLDLAASSDPAAVSVLLNRTAPPPPIAIRFDLAPATLNPAARGRWVTGVLQPPAPYAAADIDVATIRLNGTVAVDPTAPTAMGDRDGDGISDLTVRFDRAALVATLAPGGEVSIQVTGTVAGQAFAGVATLRVLSTAVSKPAPAGPAIHRASLHPATSGRLRVEFSLDEAGPARLEVMDVAGRVVASRQVGAFGPGAHALELEEAAALRSGVYFLRLSQGGSAVRARVAVIK